ncbi:MULTISPECIES: glycoside hydrolase family 19 protein [Streptomyces]|uniref:Chitinase class I n=2 Tax=Streptomyces TaxID=1883 RepID=A0A1D8G3T0_9ACTN|nr:MULTISPECIES: glycoside hydrolase family 19 protein [Streptomyces]AOT60106.1 Chitinase class I [Streptomyces rubrolavendulae]KAF0650911.1 chitinase [Streptomyces fradiae ATCC 10745 = DSM 40063]OSY53735.1 Chitinase class I [Streptomyces fradiae ATCC 10745 = DSM 40063]QEV13273.1 chitinase [Streptomyces fradiae ATCC 10745 = DSM 40063]UQS31486.1 chitinase [Streptomyces fradiae]
MSRRLGALLAAFATAAGLTVLLPASTASAADCAAPWSASSVYWGGNTASYDGRNWQAKWWTQNERPGAAAVWADQGSCGSGTPDPDPTDPPAPSGFVVSEAQFNQMFPNRNPFYTYSGLKAALSAYPAFATTGGATVSRQEAAAFLANVSHETGGLVHIVEQNTANYPHYCDATQPYGCPAGQAAYYGRGPIQLSWNFNYKAAGDALGIDLLNNPHRVEREAAVAWKTALWYWNTQNGPGTMTAHHAMVTGAGFGQTIRSINGALECDGRNPAQVQSRVTKYQQFTQILGVAPGANLYC